FAAASVAANAGSFPSSPGQKRVFSTSATPPRGRRRAGPEARVLDERDAASRQAPCRPDSGRGVGDELDRGAEDPFDVAHDMLERQCRIGAGGTTEVREQDDARAFVA